MGINASRRQKSKCGKFPRAIGRQHKGGRSKGTRYQSQSRRQKIVFIANTGSPTSFVNNKTATTLQNRVKEARRIQLGQDDEANRMVCYNGYKIPSFGRMITPVESEGWTTNTASFVVVDDKRANIMGRNLLPLLGIHLHREKPNGKSMNFISDTDQSDTVITNWVKST